MKAPHYREVQSSLPFISVIVPVYNDRDRLLKCLKASDRQIYPYNSCGVIVVERNSTEPSSLTPYYSTSRL
ncbi:glycosyltransferase, partial [Chroococcidiopsis sp.]|uniref:glycosyltransferase n=1 Tax=Chroococcidiopsis sp. TaxID=3088168 RepID=UPI003F2E4990